MNNFGTQANDLRGKFLKRGYPDKVLRDAYKKAARANRDSLPMPRKHDQEKVIMIMSTFYDRAPEVGNILDRYWQILKTDKDVGPLIPSRPGIMYRRVRSIRDHLLHSHYAHPKKEGTWLDRKINGTFRCGGCQACPFIKKSKDFSSINTRKTYTLRDFANCRTKGVVYLCKCSCPLEYIGKTKCEFKTRILEHIGDVQNRRDTQLQNTSGNTMQRMSQFSIFA